MSLRSGQQRIQAELLGRRRARLFVGLVGATECACASTSSWRKGWQV
jgi:hypothetical protein